ncbi:MAG: type II secretion system F family protein [Gammaproteobacteria bacterium]
MKKFLQLLKQSTIRSERIFYWTGLSQYGELKSGNISAYTQKEAKQKLRAQTLIIKTLSSLRWTRRLNATDITQWLQQLSRILRTGLSLQQALQTLSTFQTHPKIVTLVHRIQKDLDSGISFSESLARHPQWFDPILCALLRLGEYTGTLGTLIEQITIQRSKNQAIKQQFQTLMLYPLTVIVVAIIVTIYMLITIVPQLQGFFQHAHQTLPWSTKILLIVTQWIKTYGLLSLSIITISILYLKYTYPYFVSLQRLIDHCILNMPGLSSLLHAHYLSRTLQTLAISQQASLPLPDALQWIAVITGNFYYRHAFLQIHNAVLHGESIRSAILRTRLFPELVVQMLSIGEESGTLSVLVNDLSIYYTNSLEHQLQRLSRYVEPIMMLIVGIMIGGLMLCIYLPMIQLGAIL